MSNVNGIDFSEIATFRTNVDVKLSDDVTVTLPLLPTRVCEIANNFDRRVNLIRDRWSLLMTQVVKKQEDYKEVQESENNLDNKIEATDSILSSLADLNKKQLALTKESDNICNEILDFLKDYLEKDLLEYLKSSEAYKVFTVLRCMIYGAAALEVSKEPENEDLKNKTQE